MTATLSYVIAMALLTWVTVLLASLVRARAWTPEGMMVAFGNRENLPEATPLAGRAERTARNTMENFVFFAVIALVAHAAGADGPAVAAGAAVFFWARVVYVLVYYAGIVFLRTAVWLVGIIGMGMMLSALL